MSEGRSKHGAEMSADDPRSSRRQPLMGKSRRSGCTPSLMVEAPPALLTCLREHRRHPGSGDGRLSRATTQVMKVRTQRRKHATASAEMTLTQVWEVATLEVDSEDIQPTAKATMKAMMAARAADTRERMVASRRCPRREAQMPTRSEIATISMGGNTGVHCD